MKDQIVAILKSIRSDIDYLNCPTLIEDGLFSSLDLILIISELEEKFSVSIPMEEIEINNFNTVDAIVAMISKLKK